VSATALKADLQAELDALTSAAGLERVPGIALTVLDGDEVHVWVSGESGRVDGLPMTADTLFRIASITKLYTATLVMQLVDDGRVVLDGPLAEQLPEFRLADPGETAAITPRHLLSHTSGIPGDWGFDGGRGDDAVMRYVASLAEVRAVFPAGLMHSYSNAGFVVLGRLVEHVLGTTWDAALQERLVKPLGLTSTVTLPEDVLLRRFALGHSTDADENTVTRVKRWGGNRASGPCGIISAAPLDLIAFARLHLDGGVAPDGTRLLSEESCRLMQEEQVALTPYMGLEAWGLGFEVTRRQGPRVVGHGGNVAGQTGSLKLVPERHGAVALQTNSDFGRARCDRVLRTVLKEWFGVEAPPEAPSAPERPPDVDVERWLGTYERVDTRIELARRDGRLELTLTPLRSYVQGADPEPPKTYEINVLEDGVFLLRVPGSPADVPLVCRYWPDGRIYLHSGLRAAPKVS
jgi:CubicO group peptidase (beta-lactamase class C family)